MTLVDPEGTRLKLDREIELWREQDETYRRRGWILLGRRDLEADVGCRAQVPLGPQALPAMTACVRFDYTDDDLMPPSVEFIDPYAGESAVPIVPAIVPTDEGPRNLLVA